MNVSKRLSLTAFCLRPAEQTRIENASAHVAICRDFPRERKNALDIQKVIAKALAINRRS